MSDEPPRSSSPSSATPWTKERLEEALRALEGLLLSSEERHQRAFAERWLGASGSHLDVARARHVLLCVVDAMTHGDEGALAQVRQFWPRLARDAVDATATSMTALDLTALPEVQVAVTEATPESTPDGTMILTPISPDAGDGPPPLKAPRGTWVSSSQRSAAAAPPPVEPSLDLDQYAVLCAWTEAHPERRASLHAQYGLADEAARRRLDEAYEERFRRDSALRVAFAQRTRMHLGWIRRGG